ncbi:type VII secretion-associated protein [Corynebacterium sp. 13CS0277]|uniref:type VII secretion-associated protein n=1 Tax=Corynebacterium sp. 13CS0277 TaxID=2071994 RepID=UPI000D034213|nr:type VII secretion-associated protein [Corynebacterium sp. 13CS0277]PRQ11583.1 type VII secretion-associated protein [Corynebacterium sp. 13CS0277]
MSRRSPGCSQAPAASGTSAVHRITPAAHRRTGPRHARQQPRGLLARSMQVPWAKERPAATTVTVRSTPTATIVAGDTTRYRYDLPRASLRDQHGMRALLEELQAAAAGAWPDVRVELHADEPTYRLLADALRGTRVDCVWVPEDTSVVGDADLDADADDARAALLAAGEEAPDLIRPRDAHADADSSHLDTGGEDGDDHAAAMVAPADTPVGEGPEDAGATIDQWPGNHTPQVSPDDDSAATGVEETPSTSAEEKTSPPEEPLFAAGASVQVPGTESPPAADTTTTADTVPTDPGTRDADTAPTSAAHRATHSTGSGNSTEHPPGAHPPPHPRPPRLLEAQAPDAAAGTRDDDSAPREQPHPSPDDTAGAETAAVGQEHGDITADPPHHPASTQHPLPQDRRTTLTWGADGREDTRVPEANILPRGGRAHPPQDEATEGHRRWTRRRARPAPSPHTHTVQPRLRDGHSSRRPRPRARATAARTPLWHQVNPTSLGFAAVVATVVTAVLALALHVGNTPDRDRAPAAPAETPPATQAPGPTGTPGHAHRAPSHPAAEGSARRALVTGPGFLLEVPQGYEVTATENTAFTVTAPGAEIRILVAFDQLEDPSAPGDAATSAALRTALEEHIATDDLLAWAPDGAYATPAAARHAPDVIAYREYPDDGSAVHWFAWAQGQTHISLGCHTRSRERLDHADTCTQAFATFQPSETAAG